MYYFYGEEDYLIDKEVEQIINQNPNYKVIKFNPEIDVNDIINQISSFDLFNQNKILIFRNSPYLLKTKSVEQQTIINSLMIKANSTIVIFTSRKIDNKDNNLLFDYLTKNAKQAFEIKKLDDKKIELYVKDKIKSLNASISEMDLHYFLSKMPSKLNLIMDEIEKLVSLDPIISRVNIDDLIHKHNLGTAFDFINAFQDHSRENIIKRYNEKINYGESIAFLINQISSTLILCSQIHSLKMSNHSNSEIEKILNKHSFVIKKNIEFLNREGYESICKYIDQLAEIDIQIKEGKISYSIAFEKFLLDFIKHV